MKPPSISIFFPFLNDWGTVGSLVALAIETAGKYTDDWEVIIIDDGSTKENKEALRLIVDSLNSKFEIRIKHASGSFITRKTGDMGGHCEAGLKPLQRT